MNRKLDSSTNMTRNILDDEIRYKLIKLIERNPNISQRDLAKEMGISLGKVNYCLKALMNIGWVKAGNFARSDNKLGYAYALTPKGIKEKSVVALRFLKSKQEQYDRLREEILSLQNDVQNHNMNALQTLKSADKKHVSTCDKEN